MSNEEVGYVDTPVVGGDTRRAGAACVIEQIQNPLCPRCGLQSPFGPGAAVCRDCGLARAELAALVGAERIAAQQLCWRLADYLGGRLSRQEPFLWGIFRPSSYVLERVSTAFVLVDIDRNVESGQYEQLYVGGGTEALTELSCVAYAAMGGEPEAFETWQAALVDGLGDFPDRPWDGVVGLVEAVLRQSIT